MDGAGNPSYPRPLNEGVREAELVRSGVLFVGGDPRLNDLVHRARERFGTSMAALTIVHAEWQHVIAAVGTATGTYRRSSSFCTHAIMTPDKVFCVPDAAKDERLCDNASVRGGDGIRFYAGSSMLSGGLPVGALCVFDPEPRPCLSGAEEADLRDMANEAMATVTALAMARRPRGNA